MKIGNIEVDAVIDGRTRMLLTDIVHRDEPVVWSCPDHPLDASGHVEIEIGAFLVRTGRRTILVDAGAGPTNRHASASGELPGNLTRLGVSFDDVTDVVFTHLHYDHVGWATQEGKPAFPKATYRIHAADWSHFVAGPAALPAAVRKLAPIKPQLELFESDVELAPGFAARHAPGHTPGSTLFAIEDGGQRILLLGDVAHVVPELTDPAWVCNFDLDPVLARTVRDGIAAGAAAAGDFVAAAHFPGLRFGRLTESLGTRVYHST